MMAHLQATNKLTQCMGNIMTQAHDLDEISLILGQSLELCYIIVTNVVNVVLMVLVIKYDCSGCRRDGVVGGCGHLSEREELPSPSHSSTSPSAEPQSAR